MKNPSSRLLGSLKGLSPNIASKVELQPQLSFDDVCHLVIKIEKKLKDRKSFHTSLTKSSSTHVKSESPPPQVKALNKGKGIAREPCKRLEGKKCFKCHSFGHFQADCPTRKAFTIKVAEEIRAIEEESSEKEDTNNGSTLVNPDIENCCWSKGHSMSQDFIMTIAKGNESSTRCLPLEARFMA